MTSSVCKPSGHSRVQCAISKVNGRRTFEESTMWVECRWLIDPTWCDWVSAGWNNHSLMNMHSSDGGGVCVRKWGLAVMTKLFRKRDNLDGGVTCAGRIMQSRLPECRIHPLTAAWWLATIVGYTHNFYSGVSPRGNTFLREEGVECVWDGVYFELRCF